MVGLEIKSYCLEFYHSLAKQLLSSKNYRLEPTLAAVPVFELSYDVSLLFNTYCNTSYLHLPPGLDVGTKVWYMQRNNTHIQSIFKPECSPFTLATHQTYSPSNALPHM